MSDRKPGTDATGNHAPTVLANHGPSIAPGPNLAATANSGAAAGAGAGTTPDAALPGKREAQALSTRRRIIDAARELFAARGYAATSTGQVLERTGVARGALYHHFADKAELFAAVCETLHGEVTTALLDAVHDTAAGGGDAFDRLLAGCDAWLDAMASGDARRLLVIEAPAVLGWERWNEMDERHGFALLRAGIQAARDEGSLPPIAVDDLAILLNGAMNHAVMMARGPDAATQLAGSKEALHAVLHALRHQATTGTPD